MILICVVAALAAICGIAVCWAAGAFGSAAWLWMLPLTLAGFLVLLGALAFLFLWVACQIVDTRKPQKHDSKFYRQLAYRYLEAAEILVGMRVHTVGLENTPREGRFMLVCNHLDNLDPVTLLLYFQQSQLAFISKRENRSMFLVGKMMHRLMCQFMDRENDREALKTILNCVRLIQEDEVSIAVFPEGYTSVDGLLRRFRSGVFKIAKKTSVPIVVCTLQGTSAVLHNFVRMKPSDVHLHLVRVIQPEEYKDMNTVALGNWVYQLMADDLGPDMVYHEPEPADTAE